MQLLDQGSIQEVIQKVRRGAFVNEAVIDSKGRNAYGYNAFLEWLMDDSSSGMSSSLLWHLVGCRKKFDERDVAELVTLLIHNKNSQLNVPIAAIKTTVLHRIASDRIMFLLDTVLAAKPDVNSKDSFFDTPLHCSVFDYRHLPPVESSLVEKLILAGADVNAKNKWEKTPLHLAVNNKEVVELLLKHNADRKATDNQGKTPYEYAQDPEIKKLLQ
jgi:hypothetical protein